MKFLTFAQSHTVPRPPPSPAEHSIPIWCERPDQEDPDCTDGHGSDEGARERPRDAGGPAVQSGQILRQHTWTPQDVAGQHGPDPREEWRPLWGTTHTHLHACLTTVKLMFSYLVLFRQPCVMCMWQRWWPNTWGGKVRHTHAIIVEGSSPLVMWS